MPPVHREQGDRVQGKLRDALVFLRGKVVCGRPRVLSNQLSLTMHLYTDASYDSTTGKCA